MKRIALLSVFLTLFCVGIATADGAKYKLGFQIVDVQDLMMPADNYSVWVQEASGMTSLPMDTSIRVRILRVHKKLFAESEGDNEIQVQMAGSIFDTPNGEEFSYKYDLFESESKIPGLYRVTVALDNRQTPSVKTALGWKVDDSGTKDMLASKQELFIGSRQDLLKKMADSYNKLNKSLNHSGKAVALLVEFYKKEVYPHKDDKVGAEELNPGTAAMIKYRKEQFHGDVDKENENSIYYANGQLTLGYRECVLREGFDYALVVSRGYESILGPIVEDMMPKKQMGGMGGGLPGGGERKDEKKDEKKEGGEQPAPSGEVKFADPKALEYGPQIASARLCTMQIYAYNIYSLLEDFVKMAEGEVKIAAERPNFSLTFNKQVVDSAKEAKISWDAFKKTLDGGVVKGLEDEIAKLGDKEANAKFNNKSLCLAIAKNLDSKKLPDDMSDYIAKVEAYVTLLTEGKPSNEAKSAAEAAGAKVKEYFNLKK